MRRRRSLYEVVNEAWRILRDQSARDDSDEDPAGTGHRPTTADGGIPVTVLERIWDAGFSRVGFVPTTRRPGEPLNLSMFEATDLRPLLDLAPDGLWGFNAYGRPVDHDDLMVLARLTGLRKLDLGGTAITDASLRHLLPIAGLEELSVAGTAVTDEGIRVLAGFAELRVLNICDTAVGDASVPTLLGLPSLAILVARGTELSDDGLEAIRSLAAVHT